MGGHEGARKENGELGMFDMERGWMGPQIRLIVTRSLLLAARNKSQTKKGKGAEDRRTVF